MAERRLILHVGAPKCGSTALQSVFAHAPTFGVAPDEEFTYAVIDRQGQVHTGAAVTVRATRALSGGAPSTNAKFLGALSEEARTGVVEQLNAALTQSSVILSQEGWLERPKAFDVLGGRERIEAPIDVVAYVRPQPEFLNSSWWQWGAWSRPSFEEWMEHEPLNLCSWGDLLTKWGSFPGVRRVYARLMPSDVVEDFFQLIGSAAPRTSTANRSLPGAALRFLQRNRTLRPGRGDVDIHFTLGRALQNMRDAGTPWVLPQAYVEHVLRTCESSNKTLRSLLDEPSRAAMDADPRWWDANAYANKKIESAAPGPMDAETAEALAVALAQRLLLVERENAALKARDVR